jgi:hypothetical protein
LTHDDMCSSSAQNSQALGIQMKSNRAEEITI